MPASVKGSGATGQSAKCDATAPENKMIARGRGLQRKVMRSTWTDTRVLFALILILGAALRFIGLDWDQGTHLNPDERFLTTVETAMHWPSSVGQYFDETHSPLNPRNVGFVFFAYGTLPTTIVRGVAGLLGETGYGQVYLVGRAMSGLFSLGSIVFLFLLGRTLYRDDRMALLASFLLAVTVLDIQYAHFFVVDAAADFFTTGALYFLARVQQRGRLRDHALTGTFWGMALASKISILVFGPLVVLVGFTLVLRVWLATRSVVAVRHTAVRTTWHLVVLGLAAGFAFRLGQPDAFRGSGLLDFAPSQRWLSNLDEARRLISGSVDTPPGDQWARRWPLWFPWSNMVLWGMGLPLGLTAWGGWGAALRCLALRRKSMHLIPVAWVGIVFWQEGTQWVKTMRYFLPIYPALALLASWLLISLWDVAPCTARLGPLPALTWTRQRAAILGCVIATGTLLWALAFMSIYTHPNSRVEASRWIYAHVPAGQTISSEGWDDALPLLIDGKNPYPSPSPKHPSPFTYRGVRMNWYDEDSPHKLQEALGWLDSVDYVVESSNRLYGSIPRLPMRYPMTVRYYRALFDGSLGFKRVADFTSYPQLFGISVPDQSAEEAFTVYDHPEVQIFEKTRRYSRRGAKRILGNVDWAAIQRLTPAQLPLVTLPRPADHSLLLTPRQIAVNNQGPTYSQEFSPNSLPMRLPALFWLLWLEVLGLLALPLSLRLFFRLPDHGVILAKTVGVLLTVYLSWLAASVSSLRFDRPVLAGSAMVVGVGSLLWGLPLRDVGRFLRDQRTLIVAVEGLFLAAFVADMIVRMIYPDLWHDQNGGEKPMDFSYLNGVVRSQTMPPADPWFSGGYINYYYFGYVMTAGLIKLAGIAPNIAYNLAIPTLFALSLASAYTVGYALTQRWQTGLLAASLVGVAGNLYVGVRLIATLIDLSPIKWTFPVLGGVVGLLLGSWKLLTQQFLLGRHVFPALGFRAGACGSPSNWGWDATRVLDCGKTINEFPFFTFLYGDLHAHMMDLPIMLACVALGANFALGARPWVRSKAGAARGSLVPGARPVILLVGALLVGATGPTNSWDLPTALLVVTLGVGVNAYVSGVTPRSLLLTVAISGAVLTMLAFTLYVPFYSHYQVFYSSLGFTLARTNLGNFLTMWGLFLFILGSYLAIDLWLGPIGRWVRPRARVGEFLLYYWSRRVHALRLLRAIGPHFEDSGAPKCPPVHGITALTLGLFTATLALAGGAPVMALLLLLLGAALAALLEERRDLSATETRRARGFILLLTVLALSIVTASELVYLVDFLVGSPLYRMNTVFKLYEQAWLLFAVAASAALSSLLNFPGQRLAADQSAASARARVSTLSRPRSGAWRATLIVLLVGAAMYPVIETPLRLADRSSATYWKLAGNPPLGPTLNGTSFVEKAFRGEYDALSWLNANVRGDPTVLSSNQGGYNNFAFRVPWMTGLPNVVEWDGEQAQQRYNGQLNPTSGLPYPYEVDSRGRTQRAAGPGAPPGDVTVMYSTTDPALALRLLHRYRIAYVYVGLAERGQPSAISPMGCVPYGSVDATRDTECVGYPPRGLAKFDTMVAAGTLTLAYDREGIKIYRVAT
jgi:YYY domain-containing protein